MLRRYANVPLGIYAGLFAGLFVGDCVWRGFNDAVLGLPIRIAIFAVVLSAIWLLRRPQAAGPLTTRKRTPPAGRLPR